MTVIVVPWVALLLLVAATPILVGWEWARAHDPRRVSLRARYRRGRHHRQPPLTARAAAALGRLLDAYLAATREATTAYALMRGAQPWT